jgi:prepilin-type N-terminal cleavage/methylation domain-containing protein
MGCSDRAGGPCVRALGFSLVELLVAVLLLGLLAALVWPSGQQALAVLRVEAGLRMVVREIERQRDQALRSGEPQLLALEGPAGLMHQAQQEQPLPELQWSSTLPPALRIAANGLVIDGGTLVLAASSHQVQRCLVLSLPLGVMRLGRYDGALQDPPSSALCLPEPGL